jgi:GntR family transcriptional regulator
LRIEFDPNTPIYLQLMQLIRQAAAAGQLLPGGKVPSVRELAVEYAVNPNTVQKALAELEREGLLVTERTAGRRITDDVEKINQLRAELAQQQIDHFAGQMLALGFEREQLLELLTEKWGIGNGHH